MPEAAEDAAVERAQRQLTAARARLVLDRPFIGTLLLHLPMTPAGDHCRELSTDGRRIRFNPDYVLALDAEERLFVLCRAALHCAFGHFGRRGHRLRRRWELACELSVNGILVEEGLTPPPETLVFDAYAGLTAEEIYPLLDDNPMASNERGESLESDSGDPTRENPEVTGRESAPGNGGRGGTGGQADRATDDTATGAAREGGSPVGADDAVPIHDPEALLQAWRQRTAAALLQTDGDGRFSGTLKRRVESSLQGRQDWRALLAHYLVDTARENYRWSRPSTRRGDPAILPGLRSDFVDVAVALDVSGSVSDTQLQQAMAEINAIKDQVRARLLLFACDAALIDGYPRVIEPWEPLPGEPRVAGGGNTDFRPVFDYLDCSDVRPDVLVWFTDARGRMPAMEPAYPVLWLVKGAAPVPWGLRVQY